MEDIMTIEKQVWITVSSDEETRKAKEGVKVLVTLVFIDWEVDDYINRLLVSNSIKVSVAAVLRPMAVIPTKYRYIVPKAGTRNVVDPKLIGLFNKLRASGRSMQEIEALIDQM
jgi:hypothetical protein